MDHAPATPNHRWWALTLRRVSQRLIVWSHGLILASPSLNSSPSHRTTQQPVTNPTAKPRSPVIVWMRRLAAATGSCAFKLLLALGFAAVSLIVSSRHRSAARPRHRGASLCRSYASGSCDFLRGHLHRRHGAAVSRVDSPGRVRSQTAAAGRRRYMSCSRPACLWDAPSSSVRAAVERCLQLCRARLNSPAAESTRPSVGPTRWAAVPSMRAADAIWWNNTPGAYGPARGTRSPRRSVVATDHDAALSVFALRGVVLLAVIVAAVRALRLDARAQPCAGR